MPKLRFDPLKRGQKIRRGGNQARVGERLIHVRGKCTHINSRENKLTLRMIQRRIAAIDDFKDR